MRNLALWLGLLVPLNLGFGQVAVEVTLDQDQFLVDETIVVAVRIANRSGQTLLLGGAAGWLTFSVEARDGLIVPKADEAPMTGEFVLESSKIATKRVNLTPFFTLTRPGRYSVAAKVRIQPWDKEFGSAPKSFDIMQGIKLWEREFGVPLPAGAQTTNPEVRKYALQQANYLKQLRLYLRLTDAADSRTLRLFSLGAMVSFDRPEPQLDSQCNLHLLFQTGARSFSYTVVNPDGQVIVHQTHDYANTRPRLQVDSAGKFIVAGGVRRVTADDLPPPLPVPDADVKPPTR